MAIRSCRTTHDVYKKMMVLNKTPEDTKAQPLAKAFVSGTMPPDARLIRDTKLAPTVVIVSIRNFGTRLL